MKTLFIAIVIVATLIAQATPQFLGVRVYTVTDASRFPQIPAASPQYLVFRNGLYQAPGVAYNALADNRIAWRPGVLQNGDLLSFVTLPATNYGPEGFITVTGLNTSQVLLDTAYVTYRTAAPTMPGPCDAGSGAWAVDEAGFSYACAVQDGAFVWKRSTEAMVATW